MDNAYISNGYCYYRAAGKSLKAIQTHRAAIHEAVDDVRAFVMLCGAERALGNHFISGLHFIGTPPEGWVRNASAPLMAVPDVSSARGANLERIMRELFIPGNAEFAMLIGAEPQASSFNPLSPIIALSWPSYEKLADGSWAIKCPVGKSGTHTPPPDAQELTADEYKRIALTPHFNFVALDTDSAEKN